MLVKGWPNVTRSLQTAVSFGFEHNHDLASTVDEVRKPIVGGRNRWGGAWLEGKAVKGDIYRIQLVGLGQLPSGAGEILDSFGQNHGRRDRGLVQGTNEGLFITAGGLYHDENRPQLK
jgi:hypothetical protein